MKVGDKVVFIGHVSAGLKKDNIYIVNRIEKYKSVNLNIIRIVGYDKIWNIYDIDDFVTLKDYRKLKLTKLCLIKETV